MSWYFHVLRNYAVFGGRAQRAEFWYFILFSTIISVALSILDGLIFGLRYGILGALYSLAVFLPSMGVSFRRLHDTEWWLLIAFVPLVGAIVLLVFMVRDSQPGENRFGPNPKSGLKPNPETESSG